jgi:uncharacterized protein YwqG
MSRELASLDWEMEKQLQDFIKNRQLQTYSHQLLPKAKPAIALCPASKPDSSIPIGASKLGGQPDTQGEFEWPLYKENPLFFIAQINLHDLQATFPNEFLPKNGLLSFFYDDQVWGFDPKDKGGFRVYHFTCQPSELQRQASPKPSSKKLFGLFKLEGRLPEYKSCSLEMSQFLSLPDDPQIELSQEESDRYFELLEDLGKGKHHHLLGYAEPIQGAMELECELVTNGINCGDSSGYKDPKAKELEKNAEDWRLLLQIDSDAEHSNMMWGDLGRLYFWIKEQDLLTQNFDKCWLISQCF